MRHAFIIDSIPKGSQDIQSQESAPPSHGLTSASEQRGSRGPKTGLVPLNLMLDVHSFASLAHAHQKHALSTISHATAEAGASATIAIHILSQHLQFSPSFQSSRGGESCRRIPSRGYPCFLKPLPVNVFYTLLGIPWRAMRALLPPLSRSPYVPYLVHEFTP